MRQPTPQQRAFAEHPVGAFVEACPGAGKTQTIIDRVSLISTRLPPRCGVAVVSFTNSAIDEIRSRCQSRGLGSLLHHPGYLGTFDGFIRQFFFSSGGLAGVDKAPVVLDSWDTLGIEVRLNGARAFRGAGVRLDLFDATSGEIDPLSIGHMGLRAHVQNNLAAYQGVAQQCRLRLRRAGYATMAEVRAEVVTRLQGHNWSTTLGQAIAARFREIIIDEAQDCNPQDCEIIEWLRNTGVEVTIVTDLDQAIYGFRHGDPTRLRRISDAYAEENRLALSGNFRSAPAICSVAASLRGRAGIDTALGEYAGVREPFHLISYPEVMPNVQIALKFCDLMRAGNIKVEAGIILAHSKKTAMRASGSGADEEIGSSKTAEVARAVGGFWNSGTSGKAREIAVRAIERSILDLMGKLDSGELPSRSAERHGIDLRWLRRCALELLCCLPRACDNSDAARTVWLAELRRQFGNLGLVVRPTTSIARYFNDRRGAEWQRLLSGADGAIVPSSTIHEAKGKEYEAVCVVIPPDRGAAGRADQLIGHWENRTDDEAKRVIYVGVTRAKKLGALALGRAYRDRIAAILQVLGIETRVHEL